MPGYAIQHENTIGAREWYPGVGFGSTWSQGEPCLSQLRKTAQENLKFCELHQKMEGNLTGPYPLGFP